MVPLWGVSSAGRAPALQAGGHRFDPGTLHHKELTEVPSKDEASLNFLTRNSLVKTDSKPSEGGLDRGGETKPQWNI